MQQASIHYGLVLPSTQPLDDGECQYKTSANGKKIGNQVLVVPVLNTDFW
jgi:hypothetical protein